MIIIMIYPKLCYLWWQFLNSVLFPVESQVSPFSLYFSNVKLKKKTNWHNFKRVNPNLLEGSGGQDLQQWVKGLPEKCLHLGILDMELNDFKKSVTA